MTDDELLKHHVARLTGMLLSYDDMHRQLETWVDGMDEQQADELVDSIFKVVGDEILAEIRESECKIDMDDQIYKWGIDDE